MSVIAVKGIPAMFSLMKVVKTLARTIGGQFEALNFKPIQRVHTHKTVYLRLSEKLDPVRVVEKINGTTFGPLRFTALVPKYVPDIPLAKKPHKMPQKMRRKFKIPDNHKPHEVFTTTHTEIMTELQTKYPGLYNLSKKTGHALLEQIGRKIFERLKVVMERNPEELATGFFFSKAHRRMHPHFGDFQLVLSTLHSVQDAAGQPRDQIRESDLAATTARPYTIDNLPYEKVQEACNKYSERINKKVTEYVKSLKTEISNTDPEEEVAKKKVREELKKMTPFLSLIIKQVITKHFVPEKAPYYKLRIYGEPYLPPKEYLAVFLRKYRAVHVVRSQKMHNVLAFSIPPEQFPALKAMDGTIISGSKISIRSSDIPLYRPSRELFAEMNALFGSTEEASPVHKKEEPLESWEMEM